MAGNTRPVQHSIGKYDGEKYRGTYVFKCNGCSAEVKGYRHKTVYGHVFCKYCKAKNRKEYAIKYWTNKLQEAK